MSEPLYIDRPPRIQPELPFDEIEIPGPPDKDPAGWERLVQVALPILTIIGYIALSATGGAGRSPAMMIPMALSVVGSTGFAIYSYFREKRRRAEIEQAYSDRLTDMTKEMNQYHDQQRRFYRYNYPDMPTTYRLVKSARSEVEKAERTLRSEARLWERRVSDEDFGVIRLGMGTLPSTVRYVLGDVENMDDPQVREAMKLETDSQFVSDIPVIVTLRQPPEDDESEDNKPDDEEQRTPVTHALSIAGERAAVYQYARAMLAHYMVFHAPMNARLFVLATHKREWAWTEQAPHSQGDETAKATCFVEEVRGEKVDTRFSDAQGGELEQFLEGIRKTLSTRKIRLQDRDESDDKGDPTQPLLLVVVDLLDSTYDESSPLYGIESDAAISILVEEGTGLGAAVIFLVPERSKAPSGCQAVLEIEKTTPATNIKMDQYQRLHFRYAEVGVNTFRYIGAADSISSPNELTDLARQLAELEVRQGAGANLTSTVPFMELMGYESMPHLLQATWRNWQDSVQPRYANWLRARIGLMAGNKPRTLTFSAKRDGVHGMVAGSTGSGKSELLISLITAMAVMYDPSVLNFVLVDYKGGGAFKEFEELPHCVDIITNLAGEGVTRMFTAINAEMRRRQKLNADTGTKNIVDYREQGLHQSREPYPFLFIIIDEFAEMIADRPEYKSELESITRLGRAQGISLILAAQRPSGVTDQMRSNIKFRISLRVETPGESREMLRRTDAAFLPSGIPGRGYLQVGNDEIELIQVAYSGDKFIEAGDEPLAPVIWPQRQKQAALAELDRDQEPPELYKAIIDRLNDMARQNDVAKQRAPWPDFLPEHLTLQQTLIAANPHEPAVTSDEYLQQLDVITLGGPVGPRLALNPFIQRWLDGVADDMGWAANLDWESYAVRPVVGLIDNPYAASQLPLTVDLQRGHVVLFGASGWGKTTFVRSLVVSLAASHSPNHLHAYVLDLGGRNLGKLAELPHVGAVISPDSAGYEERVEQLLRELDDMVQKRKELLNDVDAEDVYQFNRTVSRRSGAGEPLPAIVVIIDNFIEFRETFGGNDDNVESALDRFVALARQCKPYGIHFVITAQQLNAVPSQVYSLFTERLTLKLADPTEYRAIVGGHVGDMGETPGRGYIKIGRQPLSFQIAMPLELQQSGVEELTSENKLLEVMAANMRAHVERSGMTLAEPIEIKALPTGVLYKQMLAREYNLAADETFLDGLRTQMRQNWANSLEAEQADWLQTTIGVISGNRPRQLHLEAKRDGVHGLIAGGTGSGKSELLMTLIVDLALRYDPSVLNFVLVDYKGGGAFQPFTELPHCVDIVTNLNKAAVHRMFTAINAEMQRRQALNAGTGTKDIVDYRARGLHRTHAPYPHLFIIIDEYAEMISDSPEFRDELESITRVGRAQGVNLLLASQRPIGVSDQMRANIKFRICLRVEGVDTSREMLRRSDAAYLPNGMPGRGYLQVGNDNIELIQIAYTGDSYEFVAPREDGEQPKFYDVMVNLANELLTGERPRTPWPPFLPKDLTMSTPLLTAYLDKEYAPAITLGRTEQLCVNPFVAAWLNGGSSWSGLDWNRTALRGIPGLLDDPFGARQLPLILDFARGHAVLFGASGWGKTTFIRRPHCQLGRHPFTF
ncbi:MAG: FtsK/SpoIIIE domain-containing protein [Caldilineaceae bacterium]